MALISLSTFPWTDFCFCSDNHYVFLLFTKRPNAFVLCINFFSFVVFVFQIMSLKFLIYDIKQLMLLKPSTFLFVRVVSKTSFVVVMTIPSYSKINRQIFFFKQILLYVPRMLGLNVNEYLLELFSPFVFEISEM